MNREEFISFCDGLPGAVTDQPFEEDFVTTIARHADTRKWFAAVLNHDGRDFVNLKCDPIEADFLKTVFEGIQSGWHMNKTHWISVIFGSDVPDELLCELTKKSFSLTQAGKKAKRRE